MWSGLNRGIFRSIWPKTLFSNIQIAQNRPIKSLSNFWSWFLKIFDQFQSKLWKGLKWAISGFWELSADFLNFSKIFKGKHFSDSTWTTLNDFLWQILLNQRSLSARLKGLETNEIHFLLEDTIIDSPSRFLIRKWCFQPPRCR